MNSDNLTVAQIEDYAVREFAWLCSDYGFAETGQDNQFAAHFINMVSYRKEDLAIYLTIDLLSLSPALLQFENVAKPKDPADRPYLGSVIEGLGLRIDYPRANYKAAKLRDKNIRSAIRQGKITRSEVMTKQIRRESGALKEILAVQEISEILAVL
jgi:hypothetical protein